MPKFSQQHYNAIAKDIREEFESYGLGSNVSFVPNKTELLTRSDTLVKLALRLAKRFQRDNENFKPLIFLDACSPNPDVYPLSELWDG